LAIEVSYIGSQGRKLVVSLNRNQPTVTVHDPAKRGDQAPNVRAFPFLQYSNIGRAAFVSNSNFNGMVLEVRKRLSHGLSSIASYELGKSLDDNSGFFESDGETGAYADSRNRKLDYGRSSFDVRHRVIVSWVYELPLGPDPSHEKGKEHAKTGFSCKSYTVSAVQQRQTLVPTRTTHVQATLSLVFPVSWRGTSGCTRDGPNLSASAHDASRESAAPSAQLNRHRARREIR
jgi:hypothetical protein